MLTLAEENYLKAIYHLSDHGRCGVSTNAVAAMLSTKPASVTDMLKKLADRNVISYVKYQGVTLSEKGRKEALEIIRKHRLWEVFLVEKLKFRWDEVHEIAEQLEHIRSKLLTERLDEYLGFPRYDPHGDPIPNANGEFENSSSILLKDFEVGKTGIVTGIRESSDIFLRYLDKIDLRPGTRLKITEKIEFDGSLEVIIEGSNKTLISGEVAKNLYIAE